MREATLLALRALGRFWLIPPSLAQIFAVWAGYLGICDSLPPGMAIGRTQSGQWDGYFGFWRECGPSMQARGVQCRPTRGLPCRPGA